MAPKSNALRLSEVFSSFIRAKEIAGMSPHTLTEYRQTYKKLVAHFQEDPTFSSLDRRAWEGFFYWLRTDYYPSCRADHFKGGHHA